jgi:hypothetical protein
MQNQICLVERVTVSGKAKTKQNELATDENQGTA